MKILVLQLARLGDIYMSWPALRALRRAYPLAEIHLMTRPRFAAAAVGLSAVQKVIKLPTTEIIEPVSQDPIQPQASIEVLSTFLDPLHAEHYDWIVNFTFSPLSSYITHYLSHEDTRICGYTRHPDGFLNLPDDLSAYFYAQVGVDRPNRYHLIELFATMVGQDLEPEDWRGPAPFPITLKNLPEEYLVVHVGASDRNKALEASQWISILLQLREMNSIPLVFIGAPDEEEMSLKIVDEIGAKDVYNFVGKTDLQEVFPILRKSRGLVGCDSAPIHIANFTNTPVINISFSTVNFWETGPRTLESIVLRFIDHLDLSTQAVAQAVHRFLEGEKQELTVAHVVAGTPSYYNFSSQDSDFDWFFLKALYMSEDFPASEDKNFIEGLRQLREVNTLLMDQMEGVKKSGSLANAAPFIERGEEIIETIGKLVPALQILVRWYQTEKIRIPPGEMLQVLEKTMHAQDLLQKVLNLYLSDSALAVAGAGAIKEAP